MRHRASEPFRFYTRMHLSVLTGVKAFNLKELVKQLTVVNGSCIYHHTHRFLQQHLSLSPEPPNDFAYWVTHVLGEAPLGERLASIDTVQFATIRGLREQLVTTISDYLTTHERAEQRFAHPGQEFHFIKAISFILPTHILAYDLHEFVAALQSITVDSLYYHIFESRLRLEKETNDFSLWIGKMLGNLDIADAIAQLDPYTYSTEGLRTEIIKIITTHEAYRGTD